ncbi:ParM/StbA family protein [Brevibacillus laterosporus]|uniref:ParM/StbA family protein n=1 Tax=Brevibacillus laterosporus TaxID=1465 RepID=UPI0002DC5B8F|nr:ParM/StbA family protein [Brevibacillus laterosporus]
MTKKSPQEVVELTSIDAGNDSVKASFIDDKGDIQSFSIPTVIAPAPSSKIVLESKRVHKNINVSPSSFLHVKISSSALPANKKIAFYYVGEAAKGKKEMLESKGDADKKYNNELHIVTTLTSLAYIAILKERDEITYSVSTGLPINEYKEIGEEKFLRLYAGQHEIEFLDGPLEGHNVKLTISEEESLALVEGVHTALALRFRIKGNKLTATSLSDKIRGKYGIADLGAGTMDLALFDENGLNKELSYNLNLGTNMYIDEMIREITKLDEFEEVRNSFDEVDSQTASPYNSRDIFVEKVIEPEVSTMIELDKKGKEYDPTFSVDWAWVKNVNVTSIVVKWIEKYTENAINELNKFYARTNCDQLFIVGGGLLFGYLVLRNYKDRFEFPDDLENAAYTTSIAYLIANYAEQMRKHKVG